MTSADGPGGGRERDVTGLPNGIDRALWDRLKEHARSRSRTAEPAHDFFHVERVVANAIAIARAEGANEAISGTAALLHELFTLPKSHPESKTAGDVCASHANELLVREAAPAEMIAPICAAIRDHAFSKGVVPTALESKVLQDADRLDALGAIGLARMWATCADMKRPFYSPEDPFCASRAPDDKQWGLDHVYKKLLVIPERLHLETSKRIAGERVAFLRTFVDQLRLEIEGAGVAAAPPAPAPAPAPSPATTFERIVAEAPDGIVISRNGIVLYANAAAARLLGHPSAASLVGKPMASFLDAESLATMRRRIQQAHGGERLVPREYPATRLDGQRIIAEIGSSIIEYEGAPAVIAFARDVTERSRLRAQLAHSDRLAAMGVIAAGVAHEINNPLGFMRLATEVFERKLPKAEVSRDIIALAKDVRDGVDRISAIVRDLRVFGRYEDEELAAVDLVRAFEGATRLVSHELVPRARLRWDPAPPGSDPHEPLPPVLGVETRLEQVFVNLLLNAAFAFADGSAVPGEIVVRAHTTDTTVELELSDNGPGMNEETLARMFEPFFSMRPASRTKTEPPAAAVAGSASDDSPPSSSQDPRATIGGTGLGLSICRGIVERSGGSLTASSELGKGTTMRLVLKRAFGGGAGAAAQPPPPSSRKPGRVPSRRLRILVIDDEERIVELVRSLLEGEHEVDGSSNPLHALDLLLSSAAAATAAKPTYDVVLCDLMMPELTGIDLHTRVAAVRPDLAERFVFITGGAYTERGRSVLATVTTRLMKPFSAADLREALAEVSG